MSPGTSGSRRTALTLASRYSRSERLAVGCAGSYGHSVSVSPISQCGPHGITNSTLFSVRVSSPVSIAIRSLGTRMCTPLEGRTRSGPAAAPPPVHAPVASTTCRARSGQAPPASSRSRACTPVTRPSATISPSIRTLVASAAPCAAAVLASTATIRASSSWAS